MKTSEQAGPATFDGFISYSHAADDLLAPRLQAGLQKFAKPWWKRRAVRIFRDESSLAANPHLWSSITEALEDSSWFVLLLSPDAAQSEWVGKEIEHWVANKDSDRILPVVTDGDFTWENADVTGSSVPPALQGVFTEEPRWVDLRFARGDEHLDLQNPDFSAAVADIASTIRGIPKDELASEEVRQHRRTVRTAWAAGTLVTVLAIAAVVAGLFAIGQRNEAQDNAELAQTNARMAEENARQAQDNAKLAEENAREAQQNAVAESEARLLAQARELGASAVNVLDGDPELATLLALEAIDLTPPGTEQPVEVINALWEAVQEDRLVDVIIAASGGPVGIALSADGSLLATSSIEEATLRLYSVPDNAEIWSYTEDTTDSFGLPFFSPNGELVALSIWDSAGTPAQAVAERPPDELPARVVMLDRRDGSLIHTIAYQECKGARALGWSPGGSYFAVSYVDNDAPCPRADVGVDSGWVEILDGETFDQVALVETLERFGPIPTFDQDENLYVFGIEDSSVRGLEIYPSPGFRRARVLEDIDGWGVVSPDGSTAAVWNGAFAIADLETGQFKDQLTPSPSWPGGFYGGPGFSPDGRLVFMADVQANTTIWNVGAGEKAFNLMGGPATNAVINPGSTRLYTGHVDGTVKVWDLLPGGGLNQAGDLGRFRWVNANMFAVGDAMGAAVVIDIPGRDFRMAFFDLESGSILGEPVPAWTTPALPLAGGRFAMRALEGEWNVYDPETGSQIYLGGCPTDDEGRICTDTGEPMPEVTVVASVDGTELAISVDGSPFRLVDPDTGSQIGPLAPGVAPEGALEVNVIHGSWLLGFDAANAELVAVDRETGEIIAAIPDPGFQRLAVSETGGSIAMTTLSGLTILDTHTWTDTFVELNFGNVRGIAISPDETKVALGDENGLHIVNVISGSLEQSVPLPSVSDIHWFDGETVLVGGTGGMWASVPLNEDDLVSLAKNNLTRGFTALDCETYRIDPCPSLAEIRTR